MTSPPNPTGRSVADTGTVNRALRILSAFATREKWALNELARALDLPRGSTHRLLGLCKQMDYVEQDSEGLYQPGVELHRVAGRLGSSMPVVKLAMPLLERLRDATDETAMLVTLSRAELKMFFSAIASPPHPMRYSAECNRLEPLAWGAAGRSLLAFLNDDEIDRVISQADVSPLDGRLLDEAELRGELKKIHRQGYVATHGQRAPDMHGLAVPFFDAQGRVRGSVMLTVPHFRFDPKNHPLHLQLLRDAATELMRRFGWAPS